MTVTNTVIGTIAVGRIDAVDGARLNELSARRVCIVAVLRKQSATVLAKETDRRMLTSCSGSVSRRVYTRPKGSAIPQRERSMIPMIRYSRFMHSLLPRFGSSTRSKALRLTWLSRLPKLRKLSLKVSSYVGRNVLGRAMWAGTGCCSVL